jgi:magnesium transporter
MLTAYVKTDGHVEVHDHVDPNWLDDDSQAVVWVDIVSPDEQDARVMREVLSLHDLAIEDALGEVHSPKVESYPGFLYVILHGIDHTASQHEFATHDVDFFLGRNFLVTVHDGTFRSLKRVAEICPRSEHLLAEGPASLMHRIVDLMVDNYRPEVDELDDWIDEIEKQIFDSPASLHVRDILELKRDVVSLRRVTIPQRDVVGRLARREFSEIDMSVAYRFRDVYDHLVRIADEATVFSDRITSLLEAHLSATSNRLNEVVKVLTIITTVFGPLTVLSGLFGMNVHLPLFPGDDTTQFWWILGMMGMAIGGMLFFFRRKRWI